MAVDLFLKIDGIQGESQKDNHKNEIDIISFDFGAVQHGSFHTGGAGGGSGKAEISDIRVQKQVDKASPLLFQACTLGTHIKNVLIYSQKAGNGGSPLTYYAIRMEDVMISDVHNSGAASGDSIMESITFNCARVSFDYQPQAANGAAAGGKVTAGYDAQQNKQYNAAA